jgi:hypothetical protein
MLASRRARSSGVEQFDFAQLSCLQLVQSGMSGLVFSDRSLMRWVSAHVAVSWF